MTKTITKLLLNGDTYQIKEYKEWQPDPSRTIFYYDFENSNDRLEDTSGNNNHALSSIDITYTETGGQYVAESIDYNAGIQIDSSVGAAIGSGDFTISFWIFPTTPATSYYYPMMFGIFGNDSPFTGPNIFFDPYNINGHGDKIYFRMVGGSGNEHYGNNVASSLYNSWHHIVMTRNNGTISCYIDAVLDVSWDNDTTVFPTSNASGFVFSRYNSQQNFGPGAKGDKFILENVGWSPTNIVDYYNQIKSLYV